MNTTTLRPLRIEERAAVARVSAKVVQGMRDRGATQALLVSQGNRFTALSENRFLRSIAKVLPWLAIGGFAGLRLLQLSPPMAIGSGLCMAVAMILRRAARKDVVASRVSKKIGSPRVFRLVLGFLFGSSLWMSQTNPLFAQFFQVAEDFFNTTFPDAGDVVPLVFGVIRALFLLYIAVSLVRVIQSARNDDDWVRAVA